eukprot:2983283-Alexandrium_andersonii.AAC.1
MIVPGVRSWNCAVQRTTSSLVPGAPDRARSAHRFAQVLDLLAIRRVEVVQDRESAKSLHPHPPTYWHLRGILAGQSTIA